MKILLKIIISIQLLMMSSWVLAQIPETQYSRGISYITGGVGEGETIAILAEAKQWPLLLEMSQIENGRGIWIFGAGIKIADSKKQVILMLKQMALICLLISRLAIMRLKLLIKK